MPNSRWDKWVKCQLTFSFLQKYPSMKQSPSLDNLALFVAVAETKSFSRAAERLDLPVATLSRRITVLEKEMGIPLFQRNTRHVGLTPAGEDFYTQVIPALAAVELAVSDLSDQSARLHGRISLTCAADFAAYCLAEPLTQFTQTHPEITLNLDLSPHYVDLITHKIDLAVRIGVLADSNLYTRHLFDMSLKLYATPSYLASIKKLDHPDDLHSCNFVRLKSANNHTHLHLINHQNEHTHHIQGNVIMNNMSMVLAMCEASAGVALTPELFVRTQLANKTLIPILPEWHTPPAPVHLVTATKNPPARIQHLMTHLQKNLSIDSSH